MFTITKQFYFSASHTLDTLPDDHPCTQLHGHNWVHEHVVSNFYKMARFALYTQDSARICSLQGIM